MGARGRKPGTELESREGQESKEIQTLERPSPPEYLTKDQADVWIDLVYRLPAEWFPRETHEVLAQYCRHAVAQRRVGELINSCEQLEDDEFEVEEYDRLLKMQEREGRALSSLATRMRITQQSTYDKSKKKPKPGKKPWE